MAEYITQRIDLPDIKGTSEFDDCWYSRIPKKVKAEFAPLCRNYESFMSIPIEDCDGYALSLNGILYNTNKHYLYKPEVEFDRDGKPIRARLRLRKKIYDIGELVIFSRYRVNPVNFRIDYHLRTDGVAVYMTNLKITFKEPIPILLPQPSDFLAIKFFDEYLVHRYGYSLRYVSQTGAMYDLDKDEFLPVFIVKVKDAESHSDNKEILRAFTYLGPIRIPLIEYIVQEWTGIKIPKGYVLASSLPTPTKVSLNHFHLIDTRKRGLNPRNYDPVVQSKRHYLRTMTINRLNKAIEETKSLLKKGVLDPDPE